MASTGSESTPCGTIQYVRGYNDDEVLEMVREAERAGAERMREQCRAAVDRLAARAAEGNLTLDARGLRVLASQLAAQPLS